MHESEPRAVRSVRWITVVALFVLASAGCSSGSKFSQSTADRVCRDYAARNHESVVDASIIKIGDVLTRFRRSMGHKQRSYPAMPDSTAVAQCRIKVHPNESGRTDAWSRVAVFEVTRDGTLIQFGPADVTDHTRTSVR